MTFCSIIACNYLAQARVLARSIAEFHKGAEIFVLVIDDPGGKLGTQDRDFRIVRPGDVGLSDGEFSEMAARYGLVELARSLKPWLIEALIEKAGSNVIYLDPDVQVFSSLEGAIPPASGQIVLTPHNLKPLEFDARAPAERYTMQAGAFNLGFLAVGPGARPFLSWWRERLRTDCILDPVGGLFFDQKWVDLAPAYFDHHILRDPGFNVGHWNVRQRPISRTGEQYCAGGTPLRFFHFSGFDPERPEELRNLHPVSDSPALAQLCRAYAERLLGEGYAQFRRLAYGVETGARIAAESSPRTTERTAVEEKMSKPPELKDLVPRISKRALEPGVNVVGYVYAESGVGQSARALIQTLKEASVPYSVVPFRRAVNRQSASFGDAGRGLPVFDTNIVCVNADELPNFVSGGGRRLLKGRQTIGLWAWEVETFPRRFSPSAHYVDTVWVYSEHARKAVSAAVSRPVEVFQLPVDRLEVGERSRLEMGLPEGFMFLFCFDFLSVVERKNPAGLIQAFKRAFSPGEGPVLVVKSVNGHRHPEVLRRLRRLAAPHPNIHVIDSYFDQITQNTLMANCDAYVSLHRAEGYGLTLAEAMVLGKPVIATRYSGNLEFMTDRNSYLIPFVTAEIPEGCAPYVADGVWAEPDVDSAAEAMRAVYADPASARRKAEQASVDMQKLHSPRARAGRLLELLELSGADFGGIRGTGT